MKDDKRSKSKKSKRSRKSRKSGKSSKRQSVMFHSGVEIIEPKDLRVNHTSNL